MRKVIAASLILLVVVLLAGTALGLWLWSTSNQKLEATQDILLEVKTELALTNKDLDNTASALKATETELASTINELESTKQDLVNTEDKWLSTQDELNTLTSMQKATEQHLADIQMLYPLKPFPDEDTLKSWRKGQPVVSPYSDYLSLYRAALNMQEQAMQDGYIISAVLTVYKSDAAVFNLAVLSNGDLYFMYPQLPDVTQIASITVPQ